VYCPIRIIRVIRRLFDDNAGGSYDLHWARTGDSVRDLNQSEALSPELTVAEVAAADRCPADVGGRKVVSATTGKTLDGQRSFRRFAPQDDPRYPRCPILTGFGRPRL